jgi:hypothetical protein
MPISVSALARTAMPRLSTFDFETIFLVYEYTL